MKKIVIAFEILIIILFAAKLLAIGEIVKRTAISDYVSWSADHVLAESFSRTTGISPVRDVFEDALTNERTLMVSLESKRRQLENRESAIKFEEKRMNTLKKEIAAKIEMLQGREEKIPVPQESDKEDNKRYKELAKVYEATPPDKVGALFTKMDNKTAAGIIVQMNNKKAGAVWGNLNPERAVEIARTITSM
jgi:flagellar motility protein MotE (MotC chaperone)